MSYDYDKAELLFWRTAAKKSVEEPKNRFRPNYGTLFSALMALAKAEDVSCLESNYRTIFEITRIGKEEYYNGLNWLTEQGFINYEKGANRAAKGFINLKLEEKKQVGYPTSEYTGKYTAEGYAKGYAEGYSAGLMKIEALVRTHVHPRGNGTLPGVEESRVNKENLEEEGIRIRNEKNDDENEEELPDFVKKQREEAKRFLASKPVKPEEAWCTVSSTPYTLETFTQLLQSIYAPAQVRESTIRNLGITDLDASLKEFAINRAYQTDFSHRRYVMVCFEGYVNDIKSGKSPGKVVPMPTTPPDFYQSPVMDFGKLEVTL